MRKYVIILSVLILTALSMVGCNQIQPQSEELQVMYVYVEAIGDDWIYGNNTKINIGKNHGYNVADTVKVEYYLKDVAEESDSFTIDLFGYTYEAQYNNVINNVAFSRISDPNETNPNVPVVEKPVIYLYPERTTDVFVKVDFDGNFTKMIPSYIDGWHVVASPDGTIVSDDGKIYPYLFWEGVANVQFTITEGYCIAGSETRGFFEKILPEIGLKDYEYNEFIEFWLPRMENNEYNLIQFQGEQYLESAKLDITPSPDSVLRVFMTYRSSEKYVSLEEQTFTPFVRTGFTVVEWGGTCLG